MTQALFNPAAFNPTASWSDRLYQSKMKQFILGHTVEKIEGSSKFIRWRSSAFPTPHGWVDVTGITIGAAIHKLWMISEPQRSDL